MAEISGAPDDIRTVTFPGMVRRVRQASFRDTGLLRSAVLNEGLEALGTDECQNDEPCPGTFQNSGLKRVKLPSTLRRIQHKAFMGCKSLRNVRLPDGLEQLGMQCFSESGLESVFFPASTRTVFMGAFKGCKQLRSAFLNEGLESLGAREFYSYRYYEGLVFAGSELESVSLPSTLRVIEKDTFWSCKNLKRVVFPEGLQRICPGAFRASGLQEVVLSGTLRDVSGSAFEGCGRFVVVGTGAEPVGEGQAGAKRRRGRR